MAKILLVNPLYLSGYKSGGLQSIKRSGYQAIFDTPTIEGTQRNRMKRIFTILVIDMGKYDGNLRVV